MSKPDYYRFLIVKTDSAGRCSIIYSTDNEEALSVAMCQAWETYKEEIAKNEIRIDSYSIY